MRWKRAEVVRGLVVTFHAIDLVEPLRIHGPGYYDALFREADLLIAVSGHGRDRLLELGAPEERVAIHPYTIDWTRRPPAALERETGLLRILSVGRLVEKKGLDDALAAVGLVAERFPGTRFSHVIIGSGPLEGSLRHQASGLPPNVRVDFRGACSLEVVEAEMRRCDLLLLPSRTSRDGDEEGMPNVLLEAMALGIPVVATIHAGTPELIRHGVTGFLAPEGDRVALAACLEEILEDASCAFRVGRAAREYVERHHHPSRTTPRLVRLYRRVLEDSGRREG